MIKKSLVLAIVLMLSISVTVHAQSARLKIIASFTILEDVVRNVAGDVADVDTLIPVNTDPHAYTPTPSDLAKISDADVVFVNGALLEQGLLNTIESSVKMIVQASECVEILPFGDAQSATTAATLDPSDPIARRCASNVSELDARGIAQPSYPVAPLGQLYAINCAAGADRGDGNCDPHVWFNPYNIELWTLYIRDTLTILDSANAAAYQKNAAAYLDQIEGLSKDLNTELANLPPDKRVLVTDHDALGYFADTFGFKIVGMVVSSVSTDAEPSAQQIAQLIDTIKGQSVPAVFAGVSVNPTLSQQVADEAGTHFYTLYTESLTDSSGAAPTYIDLMRTNMKTITGSLQ